MNAPDPPPPAITADAQVFDRLRSFDHRRISEEEFVRRTAALLDPARVPGLGEPPEAAAPDRVLQAVYAACGGADRTIAPHGNKGASVQAADRVLSHLFTFYDEAHQLPADIDWDHNPGTRHWGHDLNRFSYLAALADAFESTGDARYARKAVELILDWVAKCPTQKCFDGTPYVFGSYLNNAIHCRAWAGCLKRLLPYGQVRPLELLRILKSLHDQLAYIEIKTDGHAGNWPTIGCMGMLSTLAALPVFRDTDRWADYCIQTMAKQIDDQVLPDGVQDELTPHYHMVVVRNLVSASESLNALGRRLPPRTVETLRRMVHYTQQTIVPDGSARVAFNDSDPITGGDAHEALRALLSRANLQSLLTPQDQLGPEHFPYAGVALLRQRPPEGDLYLAFDGGPFGRSHQHEDKLGFWLFAYGRNLLVDPGRHLYDSSGYSLFPHLRSTRAHSTVTIDGQGQHSRARRDTWIARSPTALHFARQGDELRASAAYSLGYGERNDIRVVHRREIVFKANRYWVVFDRLEGSGEHLVESHFQFAPGELRIDGARVCTTYPDANLLLHAASTAGIDKLGAVAGRRNPDAGWFSPSYGHIEPAPSLTLSVRAELPLQMAVLLYPFRGAGAPEVSFAYNGESAVVESGETDGKSTTRPAFGDAHSR